MTLRKKVNSEAIQLAALHIIETQGVAALSMRTLAGSLGIKAPSLYDHVKNRDQVIAMVQSAGLESFGEGFLNAGESIDDKVQFYRRWAHQNRNLYPIVFQQKLHRGLITPGLESKVLGYVVEAAGGSHVRARAIWSQLHGLVDLELQGRLPDDADMDKTWDQVTIGIQALLKSSSKSK